MRRARWPKAMIGQHLTRVVVLAGLLVVGAARAETAAERGAYLAVLGDCAACHTAPGGAAMAGGRRIPTPFGAVIAPNLTPDPATGIGAWSEAEFARAVRDGIGRGGEYLYPAHPYPYFAAFSDADVAALAAYFRGLPPVHQDLRGADLAFPLDFRPFLGLWNLLYFRPTPWRPDPGHDAPWNRGAFLVEGPGHCGACHTPKTALGGDVLSRALQGGVVAGWVAPALDGDRRTGLGGWSADDITRFLASGATSRQLASGPMAEVVRLSTSRMTEADRAAIADYLKSLPAAPTAPSLRPDEAIMARGKGLYRDRCAPCHGAGGLGQARLFPRLAGSAVVQARRPDTVLGVIVHGAQAVATPGAPTGPAMPAFAGLLRPEEIAAVASYIRNSWGNRAPGVDASAVPMHQ